MMVACDPRHGRYLGHHNCDGEEKDSQIQIEIHQKVFFILNRHICQVSYSGFGLSRQDVDQGGGREDAWGSSPRSPSPSPSSSSRCRTRTAPHSPSGSPTTSRLQCATSPPPGWRWPPPSWGTTQPSRRWWRGWGTSTEWCWKGNLILNIFLPWQTWYFE